MKGEEQQRSISIRPLISTRKNYTSMELITCDYSHQLFIWKLPLHYKSVPEELHYQTFLVNTFEQLNLPLFLPFSLLIWKKLHLPFCHLAVNRENRCVKIKILNYIFYAEKVPDILVHVWSLSPTMIWQNGTQFPFPFLLMDRISKWHAV